MLNINNLNRARRILSAQQGAELSPTSNKRIKYLGKFGDGYKYALSPVDVEDWSSEELSDLPPEKYYKQKTGSEDFDNLKYADGLSVDNIKQQSYAYTKSYKDSNGKSIYYGVTPSGDEQPLSESQFNYLSSRGIPNKTNEEQPNTEVAITYAWYQKPKEQKKQLENNQQVSAQEMAKVANSTSTTQTTQPTTATPQNTAVTIPQITPPQIQGNPSGAANPSTEESQKSESFEKGQAIGQKIGAKIGNVLNSDGVKTAGEIGGQVGEVADIADSLVRSGNDWAPQTGFENTWGTASTFAMRFGPLGKAVGGGMKAAKLFSDLTGSAFGIKTQAFAKDMATLETVGGSYGGSSALIEDAANKAGKKYGLFGLGAKNRANKLIDRARIQQYAMQGIADDARDLNSIRSYMDPYYLQYESDMSGGYDQRYMHVAKLGGTLTLNRGTALQNSLLESFKKGGTIEFKAEITGTEVYDSWEPIIDSDEISLLKEGGSIKQPEIEVIETDTVQKSVIPDGALHKNKHNLDKVGVDDKEMTKKGIPVVDNNGEQQAEIELNEIIFTLEVTKELEKRYKEYYEDDTKQSRKDELALEAGKLLWKEIIYNTDDRTGLIDTLNMVDL